MRHAHDAGPGRRHESFAVEVDSPTLRMDCPVFPVAMSEGSHPFPSRTRKLSPPEPMVLRGKPRGRVGRCRIFFEGPESAPRGVDSGPSPLRASRTWPRIRTVAFGHPLALAVESVPAPRYALVP